MSKEKDDLLRTMQEARARLDKIEQKERTAQNKALVGKCFKFWNSCGGDHEHWWVYAVVVDLGKHGNPRAFKFQTYASEYRKEVCVEPLSAFMLTDGWVAATEDEVREAWIELQKHISASAAVALR